MPVRKVINFVQNALLGLIFLPCVLSAQTYFRSAGTGNWNATGTWQTASSLLGPWSPATFTPNNTNSDTIIIRSGHTVSMTASVTVDQVYVEAGGTLQLSTGTLTVANGPGADVLVEGTLIDATSSNTVFNTGARWQLGSDGTYIKRSGSSAVVWRDNYNGGISTIPATAHWRIQKFGTANPTMVTVGGMHYPNLYIENFTASHYTPAVAGYFQGSTDYPRIKGNFDIGGNGSNTVTFTVDVTHATRIPVDGNFIVRSGNVLRLWGNGFNIRGNITVDGTVLYDHDHGRVFELSGPSAQTISGTGIFKIWNLRINKDAAAHTVTLNRPLTVDNQVEFVMGRIVSSSSNKLIFNVYATHTGASDNSHVVGPVQKVGNAAFEFPVGKSGILRPIAITDSTAYVWFEDFGTGCSTGTEADGFTSANGTWTVANTGINQSTANVWYVSAEEQIGTGRCGDACGGSNNRTLHLGAHSTFGDMGASYFESSSFSCGFLGWCSITNKRVQSPVINLTGYSNITLSFDYIEFGEGSNDNATLWYYDGSLWTMLEDLPKTNCCGGVCNGSLQGGFVRYHVALPVSANNNPNVRIGFNWTNNGNGTGTDPSFAVDNILLTADAFTAEFFLSNPKVDVGTALDPILDSLSSCDYWILDRDYGNASKNVRLSWGTQSCPTPDLTVLRVARWDGSQWTDHGNGGTTGTPSAGTVITSAPVSSFSPFSIGYLSTPLPVVLGPVNLSCTPEGEAEISWVTFSESNSHYFEVQISEDLLSWQSVDRVTAAGWSNAPLSYSSRFHILENSKHYVRLKQADYDGAAQFYGPWSLPCVKHSSAAPSVIYPNPGKGSFSLWLWVPMDVERASLSLAEVHGRVVYQKNIRLSQGYQTLSVQPDVPAGLYCVRVVGPEGEIFSGRWINLGEL